MSDDARTKIGELCSVNIGTTITVLEDGFPPWSGIVDYLSHVRVIDGLVPEQPVRFTMICLQPDTCTPPTSRLLPSDTPYTPEAVPVEAAR
jgi:hypothetical protein